jgi:hypothetical protein
MRRGAPGSTEEIKALAEKLRTMQESGGGSANPRVASAMANLAEGISGLVKNMRSEQQLMRDWVEAQAARTEADARHAGKARHRAREREQEVDGLARGRRRERGVDYWPGFVDALATLLLAIMFLLSVFVLAQFLLSQEITGRDQVLNRLNAQINELTQLLALERSSGQDLEDALANLRASLAEAESERSRLQQLLSRMPAPARRHAARSAR